MEFFKPLHPNRKETLKTNGAEHNKVEPASLPGACSVIKK
jgi:hypothetical protein